MDIKKLTKNFGVKITNFDCSKIINNNDLEILKKTIQESHFICFKNQDLNGNTLAKFTKNFGDLEAYPEKDKTKGKIEIFNVSNVSEDGKHLSPNDQRVILQKNNSSEILKSPLGILLKSGGLLSKIQSDVYFFSKVFIFKFSFSSILNTFSLLCFILYLSIIFLVQLYKSILST